MAIWVGSAGHYLTGAGSFVVTLPAFQPGDLAILVGSNDSSIDPNFPTPAGWTYRNKTAAGNLFAYIWTRVLQAGDTSVTVNAAASGTLAVGIWRDAVFGTIGTFGIRSGSIYTVPAPDIAATGYRAHIYGDRSIAAAAGEADAFVSLTYGTARGVYGGNPTLSASAGICAVFFADSLPGQSGVNTATLIDFSGNAWGIQIDLGAGTLGRPKVSLDGSTFVRKPGKRWTGTVWMEKPWKRWTGSEWKILT